MITPDYVEESHRVLWPQFENYCRHNNIAPDYDDMKIPWEQFIAGATAMYLAIKLKKIKVE